MKQKDAVLKADLIKTVSKATGYTEVVVREILASTNTAVHAAIQRRQSVALFGLGWMGVGTRGPRTANDFRGKPIHIPAGGCIRFRPSTGLANAAK